MCTNNTETYLSELIDLSILEVFEGVGTSLLHLTKTHVTNSKAHLSYIEQCRTKRRVDYKEILHQSFLTVSYFLLTTILSPNAESLPFPELGKYADL